MTRARSDQALPADVVIGLSGGALVDPKCLWCGKHFRPRRDGGKAQRFCSAACRGAFYAACRTWAARAVFDGVLSLDTIRKAPGTTCTLRTEAKGAKGVVE